jgi:hypothetical protein
MPIQDFEFVGSFNNQRFPNIDAERSINLFEYIDPKGKKPRSLVSTSGLQNTGLVFGTTTGGFRAEFVLNGFEYFVIGQDVWRRDGNNVLTKLNASPLPTSTGYVGVDANNNATGPQILFVDGQVGFVWDTGNNTFTPNLRLVDTNFPLSPVDVCFIDGFLVVANGGTNQFQLSAFNDVYSWGLVANTFTADSTTDELQVTTQFVLGQQFEVSTTGTLPNPLVINTTYFAIPVDATHIRVATTYANALSNTFIDLTTNGTPTNTITNQTNGIPGQLQLGTINSHPGNIVACRTLHRRVFLFSLFYTEVWENAGAGTNLPLRRNNALLMEYGTPTAASIATSFDLLVFLSQDRGGQGSVMQVSGTESIPVSNRALDFQIAQYASAGQVSDARGIFVKENGIIFYRLNFTAANHTYVYNVTLSNPQVEEGKIWHEEQVLNGNRHPAQTHGYFNGNNFYGHYSLPILYEVDNSFVTNDGETIPRIRIGRPYVPSTYNRTRIDRFMVDIIQGLTDITNITQLLSLLTESGMEIQTESGLDIFIELGGGIPIVNPADLTIYLSFSKDGGVTYGYREASTVGGTGKRTHRTVWRKLGVVPRGQAYVPKVEFYGHISLVILGAAWSFEVMPE